MSNVDLDIMNAPIIAVDFLCKTYDCIVIIANGVVLYQGRS